MFNVFRSIIMFIITALLPSHLRANDSFKIFDEFCKADPRFRNHLIIDKNLSDAKNGLRQIMFTHNVNLISFIKDYDVEIQFKNFEHNSQKNSYIDILIDKTNNDFIGFLIAVNPSSDFVSSYFEFHANIVMTRKYLELIHSGNNINIETYDKFYAYLINEYKNTIRIMMRDFKSIYSKWLDEEGLLNKANSWLNKESKMLDSNHDDFPIHFEIRMENQARIFFNSIPLIVDHIKYSEALPE